MKERKQRRRAVVEEHHLLEEGAVGEEELEHLSGEYLERVLVVHQDAQENFGAAQLPDGVHVRIDLCELVHRDERALQDERLSR